MRNYINQRGRLAVLVSAMMITAMIAGLIPTALAAGTLTFSDVPASHTCYEDIQWAADNGIVNGYNGKFTPDGKITVEQYCTMLSRSIPEDEQDTGNLGAAKDSMLYHLRRVVRHGWTGYGAELELQKDRTIQAGNAWNYALRQAGHRSILAGCMAQTQIPTSMGCVLPRTGTCD